jgi:thiamine pyrophosphokinase
MAPVAFCCLNWEQSGMENPIVESQQAVTLVGAGPLGKGLVSRALALAPRLVAADGGANRLMAMGHLPDTIIGDLDSLAPEVRARFSGAMAGRIHRIQDQDTTDFDKCLSAISAPAILGLGFVGARIDHGLAALSGLMRRPDQRCILLGGGDAVFLAPNRLRLDLPAGTRVSLFPLVAMRGRSNGLRWPIDGLKLAPGARLGTSNQTSAERLELDFAKPGMLVILSQKHLPQVLRAFGVPPLARDG